MKRATKKQYKAWVNHLAEFVKVAQKHGKPVVAGEILVGFPSEADDPIGGMHEFRYNSLTNIAPKCVYCGKTEAEIDLAQNI